MRNTEIGCDPQSKLRKKAEAAQAHGPEPFPAAEIARKTNPRKTSPLSNRHLANAATAAA
jgi:hypothetical protein